MKIKRIAHLGIAVSDIDKAQEFFNDKLGLSIDHEEMVDELKTAFVPIGQTNLELVQDTNPEGVIARHIEKRGEGIQHVAYEVEDIDQALMELKAKGVRLIDEVARPGAHGSRVAFLHPKVTNGVLTELVEYPEK
ncbi:MAG: methylmalonyl-CoA epimerase [Deltaproteobacteria bacterium]|nr:methylmalonyl-CoA epimerase [Deltaproteobacteria bacterium]MBW2051862.1 methylmalonyl-CoA epimerase [Deltaproteobacteria bacterium]MBW2141218.1 methylmalonyl-CoA epimerase [Deltaproteobacteria bacterium]MBW2324290.1 methylmalonyl-CoA epimerase [Deltaproteobacteria bacterium]